MSRMVHGKICILALYCNLLHITMVVLRVFYRIPSLDSRLQLVYLFRPYHAVRTTVCKVSSYFSHLVVPP